LRHAGRGRVVDAGRASIDDSPRSLPHSHVALEADRPRISLTRRRYIVGRPSIIAPNRLVRQFTVDAPAEARASKIPYLRTWKGWLYLAVVIDLCSRGIVGWPMEPTLDAFSASMDKTRTVQVLVFIVRIDVAGAPRPLR
jgi:transposase InsO family protein